MKTLFGIIVVIAFIGMGILLVIDLTKQKKFDAEYQADRKEWKASFEDWKVYHEDWKKSYGELRN